MGRCWERACRRPLAPIALTALVAICLYLLHLSYSGAGRGYPLDDAWIHQTYARNLAESGQFSFVPGVPSAGSTSPLWTFLLTIGYLLGIEHYLWSYLLGWLSLTAASWGTHRLSLYFLPGRRDIAMAAGLLCATEWHLVWAAVSGMETALFTALMLIVLSRGLVSEPSHASERCGSSPLLSSIRPFFTLGLLAGALILTRPEGALLLGLIGLAGPAATLQHRRRKLPSSLLLSQMGRALGLLAGCAILVAPYVMYHLLVIGQPLPSTFYAKQAEYRALIEGWPLLARWVRVLRPIFVGPQALLLPGILWAGVLAGRCAAARWLGRPQADHRFPSALPLIYLLAFSLVYAMRLPVIYQHGRYLMPIIPLTIYLGIVGTVSLISAIRFVRTRRLLSLFIGASLASLLLGFSWLGMQAYASDVRFINCEMVATARWIDQHTPAEALLATHDIGAIGYFSRRPLLDLAGLITPEVIPIIRDEEALLDFVYAHQADYLITFPSWYPQMVQNPSLQRIYHTDCEHTRLLGQDNMSVYRISGQ